jgi:hypothetical protein
MPRLHLSRAALWSAAAALWSVCLWPGSTSGGLRDRLTLLSPPEEFHCPFGLGQWVAQQHRYVYGERAGEQETTPDNSQDADQRTPLSAPEPQASEPAGDYIGPCMPDYGCPYYGGRHYIDGDESGEDGEDSTEAAEPREGIDQDVDADAEISEALRLLAASLSDRRHDMGQRFAMRLNRLNDGLEDEIDAEFDVVEPFDSGEATVPVAVEAPGSSDEEDTSEPACEVDENCPLMDDISESTDRETGFFEALGQQLGEAILATAAQIVDAIQRWSEEAARAEAVTHEQTSEPATLPELEPRDFIPAFGSPYGD